MTTLEKIQANHVEHHNTLNGKKSIKTYGDNSQASSEIIAMLLQEILDTVRRTEALVRQNTKFNHETINAKKATTDKPIGIEDKRK